MSKKRLIELDRDTAIDVGSTCGASGLAAWVAMHSISQLIGNGFQMSTADLAREAGISGRTMHMLRMKMESAGFIRVESGVDEKSKSGNVPNVWWIVRGYC